MKWIDVALPVLVGLSTKHVMGYVDELITENVLYVFVTESILSWLLSWGGGVPVAATLGLCLAGLPIWTAAFLLAAIYTNFHRGRWPITALLLAGGYVLFRPLRQFLIWPLEWFEWWPWMKSMLGASTYYHMIITYLVIYRLVSFLAILTGAWLGSRHYLRRAKAESRTDPCCLACGYNLRGTLAAGLTVCPECGAQVPETSASKLAR